MLQEFELERNRRRRRRRASRLHQRRAPHMRRDARIGSGDVGASDGRHANSCECPFPERPVAYRAPQSTGATMPYRLSGK